MCKGLYKGSKGGAAAFEGRMIEGGKKIKGFWYDYDKGVTPAQRYECTCVIALEGHDVLKGNFRTKDGGHEEWEAKRWSEQDVPRADGKIIGFAIKDKATFERVTDNGKGKREAWLEGARATAMEESVPLKNFDGSLTYIPGPVVGAEFQTMFGAYRAAGLRVGGGEVFISTGCLFGTFHTFPLHLSFSPFLFSVSHTRTHTPLFLILQFFNLSPARTPFPFSLTARH